MCSYGFIYKYQIVYSVLFPTTAKNGISFATTTESYIHNHM